MVSVLLCGSTDDQLGWLLTRLMSPSALVVKRLHGLVSPVEDTQRTIQRRSWSSIARGSSHWRIIDYFSGWLGDPFTTTVDSAFLPLPRKGFAVHIFGIGLGFGSEASDQSAARSLEGWTFYARGSCSRTTTYASHWSIYLVPVVPTPKVLFWLPRSWRLTEEVPVEGSIRSLGIRSLRH